MCNACNTALKMTHKVVEFLSQYGNFPAIKKVDERTLKAERRLYNKLLNLQAGLETEFIRALRERGYLPSVPSEQVKFVKRIFDATFFDMRKVIADEGIKSAELGRQMTLYDLMMTGFDISFTTFDDYTLKRLWNKTYEFSEYTFERITGNFVATLAKGYEAGKGIDDVARDLRDNFSTLRDFELKRIARTEIQGMQNEGSHETMREYNVKYKQWLTVDDDRVRGNNPKDQYDHVELHGQVVEFDEPFSNGLMYPGDRSGDIGDWINCRCRERPYIPSKDEIILTTPYYP